MPRPKPEPFTPKQLEAIASMAGLGLTNEKIGATFSVSKATYERRLRITPGGSDAVLKGRSIAEQNVTATAFQMATSGKCPTMTIFWLKCRARWREPDPEIKEDDPERYERPQSMKRPRAARG